MNKNVIQFGFLVMAIVAGLLFCATPGQASSVNIGFETGDLTNWTGRSGGTASIVNNFNGWTAQEGSYFLTIPGGGFGSGTGFVWLNNERNSEPSWSFNEQFLNQFLLRYLQIFCNIMQNVIQRAYLYRLMIWYSNFMFNLSVC